MLPAAEVAASASSSSISASPTSPRRLLRPELLGSAAGTTTTGEGLSNDWPDEMRMWPAERPRDMDRGRVVESGGGGRRMAGPVMIPELCREGEGRGRAV